MPFQRGGFFSEHRPLERGLIRIAHDLEKFLRGCWPRLVSESMRTNRVSSYF
jgi:hypothetical protein